MKQKRPHVSLLIRDFKDRRNKQQRISYANIGGHAQRQADRELLARFNANVARNEKERAVGAHRIGVTVLAPVPVKYVPDEQFIPFCFRAVGA